MATKAEEEAKIVAAGSPPPPDKDTEVKKAEETKTTVKVGEKEYESPEALAKAYQSLEGKLGDQGNELGTARATNKLLTDQIETAKQEAEEKAKAGETAPTDYEAQLTEIYKQVNAGDITIEDAMQKSNAITAEAAATKAAAASAETLEATLQERDAQAIQKDFLKDHSDFEEIRNSGKLETIKEESGGMHDDFSAYFALKATTAKEEGKTEAAKLAAGDEATKTVLTKPGESIQQANKPTTPLSDTETEDSMLTALKGEGKT